MAHKVICRDHRHDGFRVTLVQVDGPHSNTGRGPPSQRLQDKVFTGQIGGLGCQRFYLIGTRHDQDALRGQERPQPVHRPLEHRPVAEEAHHLLGVLAAAERPQACAAAARHDQRVKVLS